MKSTSGTPILTRPILYFLATMILANIAGNMGRPLLPLYLQSLGADVTQVGLFFTLSAIAPLVFQIFGGWLSDIIGRLEAIAVGSIAGTLGWVVWAIAPTWQLMLPGMILAAMAVSFVAPSFDAFVAEQSTPENRGRVYGLVMAVFTVVSVIGPPLGGYIAEGMTFRTLFLIAGVMYGIAALGRVAMAIAGRRQRERSPRKITLADLRVSLREMAGLVLAGGIVTWIFVSDGVRDTANALHEQLLPIYLQHQVSTTTIEIGWLVAISAVLFMIVSGPGGWLSDRLGERVGIVLGYAAIGVGMGLLLISRSFISLGIACGTFGIGEALMRPAYQSLISKSVPIRLRGTAFGLFATSIGLISLPAPYIGGLLYDRVSPRAPFLLLLPALLLIIPVAWFKFRLPPRPEGVPNSPEAV